MSTCKSKPIWVVVSCDAEFYYRPVGWGGKMWSFALWRERCIQRLQACRTISAHAEPLNCLALLSVCLSYAHVRYVFIFKLTAVSACLELSSLFCRLTVIHHSRYSFTHYPGFIWLNISLHRWTPGKDVSLALKTTCRVLDLDIGLEGQVLNLGI